MIFKHAIPVEFVYDIKKLINKPSLGTTLFFSSTVFWIHGHEFFHELAKSRHSFNSCWLRCCFLICEYFISSCNLKIYALCCVNVEAGEVFGIKPLIHFEIILFRRHFWLKNMLALQLYSFLFTFWYWWMCARLAFTILMCVDLFLCVLVIGSS
jgi:hypothetical protein